VCSIESSIANARNATSKVEAEWKGCGRERRMAGGMADGADKERAILKDGVDILYPTLDRDTFM
jgi:hypothetical protein